MALFCHAECFARKSYFKRPTRTSDSCHSCRSWINPRDSGRLIVKEYEGAYQAVHHLIQQGHQHIGMLRESAGYYRLTERVTAYQHALQDNNLPFRPHYVCAGELNLHGGYAAAKEVLKNEEITAIFVAMMKWRWELIKPLKKRARKFLTIFRWLVLMAWKFPNIWCRV